MCDFNCVYCVWNNEKLCCSASNMKEVGENVVKEYNLLSGGIGKAYSENWFYGYGVKPDWCPLAKDKIPHWEFQYIYGNEDFPNSEVKNFYLFFKKEFLNGHVIDVYEYSNYYFFLMYDLLRSDIKDKEKQLKRLMKTYPKTIPYCETQMSKIGICCREYKGDKYLNDDGIYVVPNDFPNKKKIMEWVKSNEFSNIGCSIYITKDGIINAINENKKLYGNEKRGIKIIIASEKLPEYIQFGTVEGNVKITNTFVNYLVKIDPHPIKSFKGCPKIVTGDFNAENIGIGSFYGCPITVNGDFIVKKNFIKTFEHMPKYIGGIFDVSNNELTDDAWEYAKNNIESEIVGDYKISNNKFVKYRKELY